MILSYCTVLMVQGKNLLEVLRKNITPNNSAFAAGLKQVIVISNFLKYKNQRENFFMKMKQIW